MDTSTITFHFDNCMLFGAKPGHAFINVGTLAAHPDAVALVLSEVKGCYKSRAKLKDIETMADEDKELHPSVCILLHSSEQALAYADVFAGVAEDLKKLEENKED